MPSNERENKRKEKQNQKEKRNKVIIWGILGFILLALLIMKICEINISSVKNDVLAKTSVSNIQEDLYPYSLETFDDAKLSVINEKLSVITNNSLYIINPTDAKELNSIHHDYSNPMMFSSGNYICLIDQGGTRIRLDTTSDNKFEKNLTKRVITADVSRNGNVAYATLADDAKSTIYVVSSTMANKAKISVDDGYVIGIAINSSANKLAYATINSKDAKLITTIHTYNISAKEEIEKFEIVSSNLLKLHYANNDDCYVINDDSLYLITSQRKLKTIFKQGEISTIDYTFTSENELVLNYGQFDDSVENELSYIKPNGRVKSSIKLDKRAKSISSNSNRITALFNDKIVVYSLTNGQEKDSIKCSNDAKSAYTLSSKHFILHGQFIDVAE